MTKWPFLLLGCAPDNIRFTEQFEPLIISYVVLQGRAFVPDLGVNHGTLTNHARRLELA